MVLFTISAFLCVVAVIAIFAFIAIKSFPALQKIGVFSFVFGKNWSPERLDKYDSVLVGSYGVFKMIVSTLCVSLGALSIGGTLGCFTAVFLVFYCPPSLRNIFSFALHVLAGIPSVVYGFFGIMFVLPLLSNFSPNNGSGLLATSIILGIMILPTVATLSKTALESVPRAYYEGAIAMGVTHSRAVFSVMTKSAKSGLVASLVLGIGRALGETMAVVMVSGNSVAYPNGLFGSFRVLTANIVMEMGYAGEVQQGALMSTGAVLLVFVLLIQIVFGLVSKSPSRKKHSKRRGKLKSVTAWLQYHCHGAKIGAVVVVFTGISIAVTVIVLLGFVFVKGTPYLIANPHVLFGKYQFNSDKITVLPALVTTLMAVFLSLVIAVPLGVGTAVFLNEYAKKNSVFIRSIRVAIDVLNGVPSIVYGLFGMLAFVPIIRGTSTILSGSLTVSIMLLPTVVRSTEESLQSVGAGLREGSFALGAGKLRTVLKIVLPSALPGITGAVLLSMGRVISESAPFIYTMGSVISAMPTGYLDSNATLAVALYRLSGEGWHFNEAYATAVILILLTVALNATASIFTAKLKRRLQGDRR